MESIAPHDPLLFTRLAAAKQVTVQRIAGPPADPCRSDLVGPSDTIACYPARTVVPAPKGSWGRDLLERSAQWTWTPGRSGLDSTFVPTFGVHFGGDSLNADWLISIKPLSVMIRVGGRPAASAIVPKAHQRPLYESLLQAFPGERSIVDQVYSHLRRDGSWGDPPPQSAPKVYEQVWETTCAGGTESDFAYYEEPPVPIDAPPVRYPDEARSKKPEGKVTLHVYIDRTGTPCKIKVLRGIDLLNQAAVDGVSKWRYEPAKANHKPLGVWIEVPVEFHP
jgi:TonB family protein